MKDRSLKPRAGTRVALVTGGSRGIGRAIAVALGTAGWRVAVNYRSNAEAAAESMRFIEHAGAEAVAIQADVTSAADRARLVEETLETFGWMNLLVNNAGIAPKERHDILQTDEAGYDEVMDANLKGPFFLTQLVAKAMIGLIKTRIITAASIVNVGSISAYTSSVSRPEYCLSKAGLAMMTALYADRLAQHGIGVYEVRPGIIRTDMTEPVRDRYNRLIQEGLTPIRRWGEPEDVAQAVVAIAEGRFPFSTGEVVNVDGGFHLRRL